jgi:hypothetical protein
LFWQQPFGQPVASQMQAPPTQCCPTAHSSFDPHLQTPPAQVFALIVEHGAQATPLRPQSV